MTQVATDKSSVARTSKDWDLRAIAPFIALALLLVLGTIANPNFISIDNLLNVATRSAFIAIIALGATYVISSGGLDLSVGAMVAFVASIMILFMNSGVIADPVMMLIAAVMLALIVGAACGLLNGLITTVGGIEPFIATLGTMGIYRGLTTWLSQGGAITLRNPDIQALYRPAYFGSIFGVPVPVIVIFVTAALAAFVLYRTRYGRHVIAVGSNEDVARYSGISVKKVRTIAFIIQGLCVAVAVLLCAASGFYLGDDRPDVGTAGDYRRRCRRNSSTWRGGPYLGHDLWRIHSGDHRKHHDLVELRQRVSARGNSGRDYHHRHAGATFAFAKIGLMHVSQK